VTEELIAVHGCLQDIAAGSGIVEVYAFGSSVRGTKPPSDLDLLVLYDSEYKLREVKRRLASLPPEYPLDVLFATFGEAKELRLVETMKAVRLL
jgi:predicted nucleotidyltransferase